MKKSSKAYKTIGEVSEILELDTISNKKLPVQHTCIKKKPNLFGYAGKIEVSPLYLAPYVLDNK